MSSHSKKFIRPLLIAALIGLTLIAVALHFYAHFLSNISVELSKSKFVYSESCERPKVTLKFLTGNIVPIEKYCISFDDDGIDIGTHSITISGTNGIFGTVQAYYEICPSTVSTQTLLKDFNAFQVSWETNSLLIDGFQVSYSEHSSFENAVSFFINDQSTREVLIENLTGDKSYYVRIRTYKDVIQNSISKRFYSSWSKAQTINVPSLFNSDASILKGKKTIIIGDSLAAGYHLGSDGISNDVSKGWATQLVSLLQIDAVKIYPIVGTAFSQCFIDGGPSLLDLAKEMKSDFSDSTKESVELIIIGAGINDSATWNGYLPTLENVEASARETFEILHSTFPQAKICVFPVIETMGTHYELQREEAVYVAIKDGASESNCVDYCSDICNKMHRVKFLGVEGR